MFRRNVVQIEHQHHLLKWATDLLFQMHSFKESIMQITKNADSWQSFMPFSIAVNENFM